MQSEPILKVLVLALRAGILFLFPLDLLRHSTTPERPQDPRQVLFYLR